jgi:hypothetical protein
MALPAGVEAMAAAHMWFAAARGFYDRCLRAIADGGQPGAL